MKNQAATVDGRAGEHRQQQVAARGTAGWGRQAARVVGQFGQELVEEGLDVADAHEREERAGGGGLLGVAGDLDGQRGEPERAAEDALDDADRPHAGDRDRRLAALEQPAADPQPIAVAGDGEAAEGDERAERGEQPREHEQRGGADDDRGRRCAAASGSPPRRASRRRSAGGSGRRRPGPAARSRAGPRSARRSPVRARRSAGSAPRARPRRSRRRPPAAGRRAARRRRRG